MATDTRTKGKLDPAKMRLWEQEARTPPPGRAKPNVEEEKPAVEQGGHGELRGNMLGKDGAGPEEGLPTQERHQKLPSDIQSQFPDADLSGVTVILNSKEAAAQGVDGFFQGGAIHVAPGADMQAILRHEAAHAAQFVKTQRGGQQGQGGGADAAAAGGNEAPTADGGPNTPTANNPSTAPGGNAKPAPVAALEQQARQAETGGQMTQDQLGQADPAQQYNAEPRNLNSTNTPKMEWNGLTFDKVSGSYEKELLKSNWRKRELVPEKEAWWRIPAFPAAGLYVKAGVELAPEATLKAKGNYSWSREGNKYEVSGSLEGELKASLTGYVEGGAGLNVVIQRGGVGIRGSLSLEVGAKLSRSISFSVGNEGVNFRLAPLDFEIGAALKAALTARAWTEGWFWDAATEWTFAEYTFATLTGAKVQIAVDANRSGVSGRVGTVRPGTFRWGSAPPCTDQNGREM